jgi:hypothetical protein
MMLIIFEGRIGRVILCIALLLLCCTSAASKLNQSEQDRRVFSLAAQGMYEDAIIEMQIEIADLRGRVGVLEYRAETLEGLLTKMIEADRLLGESNSALIKTAELDGVSIDALISRVKALEAKGRR